MIGLLVTVCYVVVAAAVFGVLHVLIAKKDDCYDPSLLDDILPVVGISLLWGVLLPVVIVIFIARLPFVVAYVIASRILEPQEE